eukprot:6263842-Heterocapsa_arctica.AAC.1
MSNKEPTGCEWRHHENDEDDNTKPADDGAGERVRYVTTSRPVGIPTAVWESMSKADKQDVIRLEIIHK